MNPHALPSFIAFALVTVFGLATILQNPHDKISRLLCLLYMILALQIGSAGMLHISTSEAEAIFWNNWPYIFAFPVMMLMMEYVLQVSGGSQRLKETMLLIPSAAHRWLLHALFTVWWFILVASDQVISPAKYYLPTGWEHQYGALYLPCLITAFYYVVYQLFLLYRGVKSTSNTIEKNIRIATLIAIGLLQGFIFIPGVILPYFLDMQAHSFTAFG
jgi:hypothetical protein